MTLRGICPHGKVRFMTSEEPEIINRCSKSIADMVMAGFTFDRVSVEEARKSDMSCKQCEFVEGVKDFWKVTR